MNEKKEDRRVRKTKKALVQGLTKLMSQKKINKITVTELTDLIDINRATFYLYYKDIFDMLEQIENEMFESFSKEAEHFINAKPCYDNLVAFLTFVFDFVKEYSDMCKILLGPDGDYSFTERLKEALKFDPPSSKSEEARLKFIYVLPFAISGCIGAIQQWLKDDMPIPTKEMGSLMAQTIQKSFSQLC